MTVTIEIRCDNEAFGDLAATEIGRILRKLADDVERDGENEISLRDINGNRVGKYLISE